MSNPLSFSALIALSGYTAAFGFLAITGFAAAAILAFLIKESLMKDDER